MRGAWIFLLILLSPPGTGQFPQGPSYKDRPYMLARDPDLENLARKAFALLREGQTLAGAALLERVIAQDPREAVSSVDLDRGVGLLEEIRRQVRALPAKTRAALEKVQGSRAEPLLRRGAALGDKALLEEVVRRFPGTSFEVRASWILGATALEAGRAWEGASWFRRCLEVAPSDGAAALGLGLCRVLQGYPPGSLPGLVRASLGGSIFDRRQLLSHLSQAPPLLRDPKPWPSVSGTGRPMAPPPSLLSPGWQQNLDLSKEVSRGYPVFPVSDGNQVFVCAGDTAKSIDLLSGREVWRYTAPKLWKPTKPRKNVLGMVSARGVLAPPRGLALAGTLCGDAFVCPLMVGKTGSDASFRSISISASIPVRRLFAFDAATGKVLWHHASPEMEKLRSLSGGWNTAGPPLGRGGRIYVPLVDYGQTVSVYVGCFSAKTGEPLWRTRICSGQIRLNMFGNMTTEFVASPLTLKEGVIYGSTNLGVAFALEAERGEVKWLAFYDSIRPPDKQYTDELYPAMGIRSFWGPNAPLVMDHQVLFAPSDARRAFCLDRKTGKLLWRLRPDLDDVRRGTAMRYILGERKGAIFLQGRGVVAVDPSMRRGRRLLTGAVRLVVPPDRMASSATPLELIPRGGLADGYIYTVTKEGGIGVWRMDGSAAPVMLRSRSAGYGLFGRDAARVGNVLVVPGIFLTAGKTLLSAFLSVEDIVARTESALKKNPGDPNMIHALASALLKRERPGDLEKASELLKKILSLPGVPASLRSRARLTLRRALLARADRAQEAGRTGRALALAEEAVSISPPGPMELEARVLLAEKLEKAGKTREWLVQAREIARKYPKERIQVLRGGEETAGPWFLSRIARLLGKSRETAPQAVAAWRKVFEEFPRLTIAGKPCRNLASRAIAALVKKYGPQVYAQVETRARALLARRKKATDPATVFRAVMEQFPNSRAAGEALHALADEAARLGRMEDLLRGLNSAPLGRRTPGFLRRLAQAAKAGGNLWLSEALFRKLAADFGKEISDYPPDGGLTLARAAARFAPHPPPPADSMLSATPTRRLAARVPILGGTFTRLLRPVTLGPRDPKVPLVFALQSRLFARPAVADKSALSRDLWSRLAPPSFQGYMPSFLLGTYLLLPCRKGLAKVDTSTGTIELIAPYPRGFYPRSVLWREGLIVVVPDVTDGGDLLVHVVEPFSGVVWGERKLHFPPGTRTFLAPGPDKLHFLGWRIQNPGRTPLQYRLQVLDLDLTTMEILPRRDEWLASPLPIVSSLDRQRVLATRDHLVLPVFNEGSEGIRALPLEKGAQEWEVDLPGGERLSAVTARPGYILLLTLYRRRSNLRVLEEATGKEIQRIPFATPAAFPLYPGRNDPYLRRPDSMVYLFSGRGSGLRFLHGILPSRKIAWKVGLPGHDFWGVKGITAPVEGTGFTAAMLQVSPPRGVSAGPDLYVVDNTTGELLKRIPGLVGPGRPQLLAAGKGLLFAYCQGTLGVAAPRKGGDNR